MKLYLVERLGITNYDEYHGFVIRAKSHKEARAIAMKHDTHRGRELWCNPKQSTCTIISNIGKSKVILYDFSNG